MTSYEQLQILAIDTAKFLPADKAHEMIADSFWLTFSLLYQEMISRKEITRLQDIGKDKALLYWTESCIANPGRTKLKKVCAMQALYMYDLIIEKT